ncbi:hypothetical protein Tco_1190218 [Tanacetum coccineum]
MVNKEVYYAFRCYARWLISFDRWSAKRCIVPFGAMHAGSSLLTGGQQRGKKYDRKMLDSIDNGPLVYPTIEENGQTRPKKYSELIEAQQLQDNCDVQATHIILHGLPPDVYALVNHQEAAKDIWDRVKLLMKGTELSYQEPDQWHAYYWDDDAASSSQYQVFECSSTGIEQDSPIHHQYHHTPVNPQQQSVSLQPFISPPLTQQSQAEIPQLDPGLAVPTF